MTARLPREVKQRRGTHRPGRDHPAAPVLPPRSVPPPPKRMNARERAVWAELAVQVEANRTFTASTLTSFTLLVKAVTLAYGVAPDMPPSAGAKYVSAATALLRDFGLSPASADRVPSARGVAPETDGVPLVGGLRVVE